MNTDSSLFLINSPSKEMQAPAHRSNNTDSSDRKAFSSVYEEQAAKRRDNTESSQQAKKVTNTTKPADKVTQQDEEEVIALNKDQDSLEQAPAAADTALAANESEDQVDIISSQKVQKFSDELNRAPVIEDSTAETVGLDLVDQSENVITDLQKAEAAQAQLGKPENNLTAMQELSAEQAERSGKILPLNGNNSSEKSPLSIAQSSTLTQTMKENLNTKTALDLSTVDSVSVDSNMTELLTKTSNLTQPFTLTDSLIGQPSSAAVTSPADSNVNSLSQLTNNLGNLTLATDKLATSRATPTPMPAIQAPFGSEEWNNQIGNRIRWMGRINIGSAELQLHPAELGALTIKITTENDQTKVNFISNNATTRELLEESLPKLKDLLADSGLELEQGDVSAQSDESTRDQQVSYGQGLVQDTSDTGVDIENQTNNSRLHTATLNQINHYV